MADAAEKKRNKKSRKERLAEQRAFERDLGLNKGTGVRYDKVADRHLDDVRFERELAFKKSMQPGGKAEVGEEMQAAAPAQSSATYDAFMRMATGRQERTIADKINDSNRPTWDEYKKKNEELLDMDGVQHRKMMEYRKTLDEARERELARGTNHSSKRKTAAISSSDEDDSDSQRDKKRKKEKKKHKKKDKKKKHKKHKKSKKSSESDGEGGDSGEPVRLSAFFAGSDDESS
uniref:Uncharacterized protein n=1 Tax=Rhizochromulina marina TaxID=1034831 RepID=A0A7S2SNX5_9STRA|eukprot:CAMPEP_0118976646 /NCGR_PEP_ID=MMETSP1173-20130426/19329_1 /TAXON_ID=1034831 /ORGANISM="Rhizochromulina marina cf, Strain CCMP1243" /LENGTH=232 /DNA_ID=CAMNT_0006926695 /DNA_START=30 /DNA_END=728 /DNA_ORIENTATION=-